MRPLLLAAALLGLTPAANAADWIAVCYDQDSQYTQTIGGAGYFHVANHDGTYDTQKLVQTFYDGNTVCSVPDSRAPKAQSEVAEVCADRTKNTVSVMLMSDVGQRVTPENARVYCSARISVY